MKRNIRIEVDPDADEEIIIRCHELNDDVIRLQHLIEAGSSQRTVDMTLKLGEREYLVPVQNILFFESTGRQSVAHTQKHILDCDKKLQELEEELPGYFMRISKSAILNLRAVTFLKRDITGACEVGLQGSEKVVYVSRMYYKPFRLKLDELRLNQK